MVAGEAAWGSLPSPTGEVEGSRVGPGTELGQEHACHAGTAFFTCLLIPASGNL